MTSGYAYGQGEPVEHCPYCNTVCRADFVDVGVGFTQCGPFHCDNCGATEIGPYDEERPLTEAEQKRGWYAPGSEPGSSANVIAGKVVSHVQMRQVYRDEFVGNLLHDDESYVDAWYARIRKSGP